jgi:DNA repair protein RecO (recombination protein O)
VSREAGEPYRDRLLPLPAFLNGPLLEDVSTEMLQQAFVLTGYFLERHIFDAKGEGLPEVRLNFLRAVAGAVAAAA